MKAEILIEGYELLILLNENEDISFINLEKISKIKGNELRELLKYLKQKEYIRWRNPLFIGTLEKEINIISEDKIRLLPKGMEIVIGQRDYFEEMGKSSIVHNETHVSNSSEVQVAQTTGNHSPITQIQDNSKMNTLKQIIENDSELDDNKKKGLLDILRKFNTLKESGENAFELIKKVSLIAVKYLPLFFSLLK